MREVIVVRDWGDEVNRRAVAGGADGSAQFASAMVSVVDWRPSTPPKAMWKMAG